MTADRWFEVDRAGFAANLTDEDRVRAEAFHDACCRLGAALRTVTITLDETEEVTP